jgi:anti-sigma regulatory factor (Ser/Thr protein kinase)
MTSSCSGRYEARIENLPAVLDRVIETAEKAGLAQSRLMPIQLALEEAMANVVHHAYGDKGGPLDLACEASDGAFLVEIADQGPAFNPLETEEAPVSGDLDDLEPGGLGILLILKLADHVAYRREGGRNILSLRFDIQGAAS